MGVVNVPEPSTCIWYSTASLTAVHSKSGVLSPTVAPLVGDVKLGAVGPVVSIVKFHSSDQSPQRPSYACTRQ